jgi:phosphonatase-like hydrolase
MLGHGADRRPATVCRSLPHTVASATSTSASPGPGTGEGNDRTSKLAPPDQTRARTWGFELDGGGVDVGTSRPSALTERSSSRTARPLRGAAYAATGAPDLHTHQASGGTLIELVVFDMAGTTVEEGGAVYQAIADAVAAHLGREVPDELLARWTGAEKREAIHGLLIALMGDQAAGGAGEGSTTIDDAVVDQVFADFAARLDDAYLTVPPEPIPGAEELFDHLRRNGTKVALTTGFTDRVAQGILDQLGWAVGEQVDALVTAEQVGAGRPSPKMIQRAAQLTGVDDPAKIVVVGDTVRDLEAGRNADARAVVGVLTGAQGAAELGAVPGAHVIDRCADLPALLATW